MINLDEFQKSCYHTQFYVIVPLLNRMKINKLELFTRGKLDNNKLNKILLDLYEKNFNK